MYKVSFNKSTIPIEVEVEVKPCKLQEVTFGYLTIF